MSKKGVYFTKKEPEKQEKKQDEDTPKNRKNIITALVFAAFALASVIAYISVRANGTQNLVPFMLAFAIVALIVEIGWASRDKKSFVLWRKLFNKDKEQ